MDQPNAPAVPTSDETTLALLAHVLQIFTWWIGPLAIYLAKRDSKFVSFHAMQALLWQFTNDGTRNGYGPRMGVFLFSDYSAAYGEDSRGESTATGSVFCALSPLLARISGILWTECCFRNSIRSEGWPGRVGCLSGAGAMGTPNCRALKKSKQFTWLV
jgi:hypothetical protein